MYTYKENEMRERAQGPIPEKTHCTFLGERGRDQEAFFYQNSLMNSWLNFKFQRKTPSFINHWEDYLIIFVPISLLITKEHSSILKIQVIGNQRV